jgi:hypothetical protein
MPPLDATESWHACCLSYAAPISGPLAPLAAHSSAADSKPSDVTGLPSSGGSETQLEAEPAQDGEEPQGRHGRADRDQTGGNRRG